MGYSPVIARKFAVFVDLTSSRKCPSLRALFVIVLTSIFLLASCKSTASVELMDAAETANETTSEAPSVPTTDESTESSEPATDPDPVAPSSSDDEPEAPAADAAKFTVRGELPLSTDEVNALIFYIEEDTGRSFLTPPVIVAQSSTDFFAGLEDDMGDFQADSEISVRSLQALGLTTSGVAEVTQAFQELLLSPEGILGYYDPEADELYVPVDTPGDDAFRSLLVHELTHALDGQHADLNRLDELVAQGDESGNYEPVLALQAVAEGRASSVQNRWMADNNVEPEVPDDLSAFETVPAAMVLALSVPYAFGEQYIESNGGAAATWDLLDTPPASSEIFMVAFSDASGEAILDVPTPTADGPVLDEAVYGAADILVWLLGEELEPDPALLFPTLTAIDGWAGGRAVLWGNDSQSCMRIAIAADSPNDLGEIEAATSLWAGDDPDRSVRVEGDLVVATGCAVYIP